MECKIKCEARSGVAYNVGQIEGGERIEIRIWQVLHYLCSAMRFLCSKSSSSFRVFVLMIL